MAAARRSTARLLAGALAVGAVLFAGRAFVPSSRAVTSAGAAAAAAVAGAAPALAEGGFLEFGKVKLGGGFELNLNIPETGLVNILVIIAGLFYLLGPLLGEAMANREKEIQQDIDDAIAKFAESEQRMAEAEKNRAQADAVVAEIEASIAKDKDEFKTTNEAMTAKQIEQRQAVMKKTLQEMQASEAAKVATYINETAINSALKELQILTPEQKDKYMDLCINSV